jgi:predicted nuclease of predicted toxin-antitoxin system
VKILIDECVDQRLRLLFSGHDCETAAYAKLSALKNGALLTWAEAAGFEVIVTADQEIPYQQNLAFRKISVVVLCAPTNRLADLRPLVPAAIEALGSLKPGQVIRIAGN